jgi:type II secretory pathway component PulC
VKLSKTTILLLVALLGVWGVIGYFIYGALKAPAVPVATTHSKKHQATAVANTFTLLLNYNSPFNSKYSIGNTYNQPKTPAPKPQPKKAVAPPPTPPPSASILYLGIIRSNGQNPQQLLIKVNGEERLLEKNQRIEGFKIKKITLDSLILYNSKETKILKRE